VALSAVAHIRDATVAARANLGLRGTAPAAITPGRETEKQLRSVTALVGSGKAAGLSVCTDMCPASVGSPDADG